MDIARRVSDAAAPSCASMTMRAERGLSDAGRITHAQLRDAEPAIVVRSAHAPCALASLVTLMCR